MTDKEFDRLKSIIEEIDDLKKLSGGDITRYHIVGLKLDGSNLIRINFEMPKSLEEEFIKIVNNRIKELEGMLPIYQHGD